MKSKISIFFLVLFSISVYPQNDFKVISSNRNSIVVEYNPIYTDTSAVTLEGNQYYNINLFNGVTSKSAVQGTAAIPVRLVSIGVPAEYGNTIQILNSSYREISGRITPVPKFVKTGGISSPEYYVSPDYSKAEKNAELVTFGNYGSVRNMPVQTLVVSPVRFNPVANKIKLYTQIVFRVNFSSNQNITKTPESDLLKGVVLNYNAARYWTKLKQKKQRLYKSVHASVLSTGKWVRFETPEEGIYKITRDMLPSYGIDPNTVDPRTIKIYNNGGKMLPESVDAPRPDDLVENAVTVVGEADGKFDANDYILFYGRGSSFWYYDSTDHQIKREFNFYSAHNYYWITSGGEQGKRIKAKQSLNTSDAYHQTSSEAFASWEEDKINIGKSGRRFLGDAFSSSSNSHTYTTKLDGRLDQYPVNYTVRFINASPGYLGLKVSENSSNIINQTINGYGADGYTYGKQFLGSANYSGTLPDNVSLLRFSISASSVNTIGYLDYFEIRYQRDLKAVNDYLAFYSKDTNSVIDYHLQGFTSSEIEVYDVSDPANIQIVVNPVMVSGGEFEFQAMEYGGKATKYIACGSGKYKTPVNPEAVDNQNLHGIADGAKFIIITPPNFEEQAIRLKNFKEKELRVPISTIVVDINQVWNEFSGGSVDPTGIRNFIQYAFNNWQVKPEYVLLFGDATYDYKNIEGGGNNYIPTYETDNSLYEIYSYPKDDYYVCVDGDDLKIDLAIGRLPIQSVSDAQIMVDKIVDYQKNLSKGSWRNLITLVADDMMTSSGPEANYHTPQSEELANYYIPPSFNLDKIYLAAYPTEVTGLGRRKPEVNQAIIDAINNGTVIVNYVGHGSPELWAHERVFVQSTTIPQLHNDQYFFLTAATCDFGYFDLISTQSGAEALVEKEKSGAIGAFSASRPVYSQDNSKLNNIFYTNLFLSGRDTLNLPYPIGIAYLNTKATGSDSPTNDNKYLLLCDPTIRLDIPEYTASIDSVNGNLLTTDVQIKALGKVKIDGVVLKPDKTVWKDYNGDGILTVFDSERIVTLAQLNNYPVTQQGGVIFRGRISIVNGKFSSEFNVPKDISYENKNGKIVVYFVGDNVDGVGYTNKIIVGGTDSSVVNDGKGPDIEIFFDNTASSSAYLVGPDSKLIVKLNDETGLNTTGTGIGHKLEGILNNKETNPIDFTRYFTGDLDAGGKSGEINYNFENMDPGQYKIEVKAWDIFNNFSSTTSYFDVVDGNELTIRDVYNYPNPFRSNTTFTFQHNLNRLVDVKIKIYTVAGRLIKNLEKKSITDKYVTVDWDGRDEDGNLIANGTYLYKVIVKSVDGELSRSALGKLAVIR